MINTSDGFKLANLAPVRRTRLRVPIRVTDPELQYGEVTVSAQASMSKLTEVYDGIAEAQNNYTTLERNRWMLDGSQGTLEDDFSWPGEVGYVSDAISGDDGAFSTAQTVTMHISGVTALRALTLAFPSSRYDGYPTAFTVAVSQGGTVYYTETVTDNREFTPTFTGFVVYDPDQITLSIMKWSLPHRRARVVEIYPGYLADWTEKNVAAAYVQMQASVSSVTLPFGTASLTIDNSTRLFDPRNRSGLFQALEERQPVPIELGLDLPDGSTEYVPVGTYYQHDRGWSTRDSGATMRWNLVDIIGLLTDTVFSVPDVLPTTLEGWVSALCASLGTAFASRYTVDADYASVAVTATEEAVTGKSCADILRWLCQFTGTFARADQETGYLAVEPFWSQGNEYTLDNINDYPTISANDDLATITFQLEDKDYVVSGNTTVSGNNITMDNPFVTTEAQALETARHILVAYGGERTSVIGRGDPSSEIGDVATIQLDESIATTGRLISMTLDYSNGMLRNCRAEFLRADGTYLYENREVITESGTWTAPAGVTELSLVLVGGGAAGGRGEWGTYYTSLINLHAGYNVGYRGENGENGPGGKVWHNTIQINPLQTFNVTIGTGGIQNEQTEIVDGGVTTFGSYSSANGRVYDPSYTDAASGSAYGRTGVDAPIDGTGDGGEGGAGGGAGNCTMVKSPSGSGLIFEEINYGTPPKNGVSGASGCVIIYYNKEGI